MKTIVRLPSRPRRFAALALSAGLLWICAPAAYAAGEQRAPRALYSCQDANGRTLASDRPIPECAARTVRELRPDGIVQREVPPPPTAEELRRREAEERARQIATREQRQARARDHALLQAYADMDALDAARQRRLAAIDDEIIAARKRLGDLQEAHKPLHAQAGGKLESLPPPQRQRLSDLTNAIVAEEAFVARRSAERQQAAAQFDDDAARLRQLLGDRSLLTPVSGAAVR
ncbi:MAG: hypothetical protein AB7L76_05035 [Burkholderiaceae bacterium]